MKAGSRRMLYLACFVTVFLLSGRVFLGAWESPQVEDVFLRLTSSPPSTPPSTPVSAVRNPRAAPSPVVIALETAVGPSTAEYFAAEEITDRGVAAADGDTSIAAASPCSSSSSSSSSSTPLYGSSPHTRTSSSTQPLGAPLRTVVLTWTQRGRNRWGAYVGNPRSEGKTIPNLDSFWLIL